jgi:hypothetical protein
MAVAAAVGVLESPGDYAAFNFPPPSRHDLRELSVYSCSQRGSSNFLLNNFDRVAALVKPLKRVDTLTGTGVEAERGRVGG